MVKGRKQNSKINKGNSRDSRWCINISMKSKPVAEKEFVVIFDLDGTLFRTRDVVLPAVKSALKDAGLPGAKDSKIISLLGEKTDEFCRQLAYGADDEQLSTFIERLGHHEIHHIRKKGTLFEGTKEVLDELKIMGYPIALCSNGSVDYVEFVLYTMDIMDYFDFISCDEKQKTKGEMIKDIQNYLELQKGVMVGDSKHDISGASSIGMPSVGVKYGYGDISGATYKIKQIDELLDIVQSLTKDS